MDALTNTAMGLEAAVLPSQAGTLAHKQGTVLDARGRLRLPRASGLTIVICSAALVVGAACLAAVANRDVALVSGAMAVSAVAFALYVVASGPEARARPMLAATVILWILLLSLASERSLTFTAGSVLTGLVVPLTAYQMLVFATPVAVPPAERLVLIASSSVVAVCGAYLALSARQPTLLGPFAKCLPACDHTAVLAGSRSRLLDSVARFGVRVGWLTAVVGVAISLTRRFTFAGAAERWRTATMVVVAIAYAAAVAACVGIELTTPTAQAPLTWVSVIAATALALAMLAGLVLERLFLGRALEQFVSGLSGTAPEDVPALIAGILHDPSAPSHLPTPAYAVPSGPHGDPLGAGHEHAGTQTRVDELAATICPDGLPDEHRFMRAAGAAALISREKHRLERDLSASTAELAASRKRIAEAAYVERQRIERDLHDGIQQRIVGARVKLELADEALDTNPTRGRRMLAEVGCDMDEAVEEVRSLAQGVYPSLLATHGVVEALRSVARRSPGLVTVRGKVSRYPADAEAAVYFCCLETLQNVAKHAGRQATATVRLWEDGQTLRFETRDTGVGFTPDDSVPGRGLVNMRDRLAAVGGRLTVTSRPGVGATVGGCVPLAQ